MFGVQGGDQPPFTECRKCGWRICTQHELQYVKGEGKGCASCRREIGRKDNLEKSLSRIKVRRWQTCSGLRLILPSRGLAQDTTACLDARGVGISMGSSRLICRTG